jgi:hypothetical protein
LNAEAWWYFERAVALGMDQDATLRGWLGEVEGALAETHVKVTLASDVPGTEVKFQHGRRERWYVMPLVWWFVPGTYLVPARVPGQKEISLKVVVEPRSEQLKFKLAATPGPGETPGQDGPTEKGAAPVVEPPPAGNGGLRWDAVPAWKWLLLGGAGLMGVGGAAFYLVASSNLDEQRDKHAAAWADETGKIPPKDQDAADADWQDRMDEHVTPYEVAGYVLLGAGGAAAVASALLICPDLTAGEEKARVVVLPLAIPGGGGALIEMAF